MDRLCWLRWGLACALAGAPLAPMAAQTAGPAEMITAAEIAHHIGVIADDSMQGRDTPSRGLEATARYVASQFAEVGLEPASDLAARADGFGNGSQISTWFQRYPVPIEPADLAVVFAAGDRRAVADFTTAAYLPNHQVPDQPAKASVLFVAGRPTPDALQQAHTDDKLVMYFATSRTDTSALRVANWLVGKSRGLVYLFDDDSTAFARRLDAQSMDPLLPAKEDKWVASMRAAAVPGLTELLATVGVSLPQLRTDTASVMRELPTLQLSLERRRATTDHDTATTAPNVVGVLQGTDSVLKGEYVVVAAHMDHTGVIPGQTDSIWRGANDNASGVAGLIALAKAFSQPGARPRRSVIFLATSGGTKAGFWGSRAFVAGLSVYEFFGGRQRVLPVIADLNLDMIGGPPRDTVAVDGLGLLDIGDATTWIAATHPELQLAVVDGGSVFRPASDYFPFTAGWLALPSLGFHDARHDESSRRSDSADAEHAARVARLVFYIGEEIMNTDNPPRWNGAGRRELVDRRQ